jgi:ring-1,2-phenylacetyl-CoA epoxidase subunit PaaE
MFATRVGSRSIISNVTEERPAGANAFHALTVARVDRETRDAIVVTFAVPPELRERFRFAHGQFLTLRATVDGEELRRSYSTARCASRSNASRAAASRIGRTNRSRRAP